MPRGRRQANINRSKAKDAMGSSLRASYPQDVYSWPVTNSGGFLYQGVPVSPMVYTFSDHPRQVNPTFGYVAPPPQLRGSYEKVIGKKKIDGSKNKQYVSVL